MSEAKFTPGPWEVRYGCVCDYDEGFGVASKVNPSFGIVAECWPCSTTPEIRKELQANARLIAAAPDLYAALESALGMLRLMGVAIDEHAEGRRIVAALAKARGQS